MFLEALVKFKVINCLSEQHFIVVPYLNKCLTAAVLGVLYMKKNLVRFLSTSVLLLVYALNLLDPYYELLYCGL